MFKPLVLVALALTLAIATPISAQECVGTTSTPEVAFNGYYVDIDCNARCVFLYQESNGISGLQRGDNVKDDTCGGGYYGPDTRMLA